MLQGQELVGEDLITRGPGGLGDAPGEYGLSVANNFTPLERSRWLRATGLMSLAGIAGFVVAVAALHGFRSNLDPADHTLSQYSLGSYGWLMRAAFSALGTAVLATAAGLLLRLEPSNLRRVGLLLLVATAVGLLLDAGFNTDRLGVAETFNGAVHGDGLLVVSLALPAAAYILGRDFARCGIGARGLWLQVLGPALLLASGWFETCPAEWRGLAERIAVAMGVVAVALLRSIVVTPAGPPPAPGDLP